MDCFLLCISRLFCCRLWSPYVKGCVLRSLVFFVPVSLFVSVSWSPCPGRDQVKRTQRRRPASTRRDADFQAATISDHSVQCTTGTSQRTNQCMRHEREYINTIQNIYIPHLSLPVTLASLFSSTFFFVAAIVSRSRCLTNHRLRPFRRMIPVVLLMRLISILFYIRLIWWNRLR